MDIWKRIAVLGAIATLGSSSVAQDHYVSGAAAWSPVYGPGLVFIISTNPTDHSVTWSYTVTPGTGYFGGGLVWSTWGDRGLVYVYPDNFPATGRVAFPSVTVTNNDDPTDTETITYPIDGRAPNELPSAPAISGTSLDTPAATLGYNSDGGFVLQLAGIIRDPNSLNPLGLTMTVTMPDGSSQTYPVTLNGNAYNAIALSQEGSSQPGRYQVVLTYQSSDGDPAKTSFIYYDIRTVQPTAGQNGGVPLQNLWRYTIPHRAAVMGVRG